MLNALDIYRRMLMATGSSLKCVKGAGGSWKYMKGTGGP